MPIGGFSDESDQGQALRGIQDSLGGSRAGRGAMRGLPDDTVGLPVIRDGRVVSGQQSGLRVTTNGDIYWYDGRRWKQADGDRLRYYQQEASEVFRLAQSGDLTFREAALQALPRMQERVKSERDTERRRTGAVKDSMLGKETPSLMG